MMRKKNNSKLAARSVVARARIGTLMQAGTPTNVADHRRSR